MTTEPVLAETEGLPLLVIEGPVRRWDGLEFTEPPQSSATDAYYSDDEPLWDDDSTKLSCDDDDIIMTDDVGEVIYVDAEEALTQATLPKISDGTNFPFEMPNLASNDPLLQPLLHADGSLNNNVIRLDLFLQNPNGIKFEPSNWFCREIMDPIIDPDRRAEVQNPLLSGLYFGASSFIRFTGAASHTAVSTIGVADDLVFERGVSRGRQFFLDHATGGDNPIEDNSFADDSLQWVERGATLYAGTTAGLYARRRFWIGDKRWLPRNPKRWTFPSRLRLSIVESTTFWRKHFAYPLVFFISAEEIPGNLNQILDVMDPSHEFFKGEERDNAVFALRGGIGLGAFAAIHHLNFREPGAPQTKTPRGKHYDPKNRMGWKTGMGLALAFAGLSYYSANTGAQQRYIPTFTDASAFSAYGPWNWQTAYDDPEADFLETWGDSTYAHTATGALGTAAFYAPLWAVKFDVDSWVVEKYTRGRFAKAMASPFTPGQKSFIKNGRFRLDRSIRQGLVHTLSPSRFKWHMAKLPWSTFTGGMIVYQMTGTEGWDGLEATMGSISRTPFSSFGQNIGKGAGTYDGGHVHGASIVTVGRVMAALPDYCVRQGETLYQWSRKYASEYRNAAENPVKQEALKVALVNLFIGADDNGVNVISEREMIRQELQKIGIDPMQEIYDELLRRLREEGREDLWQRFAAMNHD